MHYTHFHLSKNSRKSPLQTLAAIGHSIWTLPAPVQRVCNVQFFAWMGWFPFLFYSTTWVAEIYSSEALQDDGSDPTEDKVGQATRAGSLAFLIYSLVSLGTSIFLPLMVSSSYAAMENATKSMDFNIFGRHYSISSSSIKLSFLTLPRAWTISHFVFCFAMLSTIFASNVAVASILIGICGISWSVTMWAPFSLIGEYIAHAEFQQDREADDMHESQLGRLANSRAMASTFSLAAGGAGLGMEGGIYHLVETAQPTQTSERVELDDLESPIQRNSIAENPLLRPSVDSDFDLDSLDPISQSQHQQDVASAGVLLGIHNMYIVLPQFLITFLSSILFHFIESSASGQDTNAIGIVLRFGAVMAGIACYLSLRIR
jgi:solute carrier family 45 protein 1/2/4